MTNLEFDRVSELIPMEEEQLSVGSVLAGMSIRFYGKESSKGDVQLWLVLGKTVWFCKRTLKVVSDLSWACSVLVKSWYDFVIQSLAQML